jgi:tetratricopeptide (TPR) repeat protein
MRLFSNIKFTLLHLLLPALLLLTFAQQTAAGDKDKYPLSEQVHQSLSSTREMLDKQDYRQAEITLNGLLQKDINPYERALTNQMLGYVYNADGKRDQAAAAFNKALADDLLPENVTHDLQYSIAQLLAQEGKYKEALDPLLSWFKSEKEPKAEAHLLAATIYYQLQDYRNLTEHMEQALGKTAKPEQSWYEMLLAGYYQGGDFAHAAAVLERMLVLYPDKHDYWLQLAGMYQKAEQPGRSLAVLELALRRGLLDENGIMQVIRLHLNQHMPQQAAVLLQEQMDKGAIPRSRDNLDLLAGSWLLAREYDRAAAAFTELATLTSDPSVYYRLGYVYFTQEKWESARKALETAVKGGALADKPDAYLLLGISAYHTNEITGATKAFNQALNHESTRQQARWWLNKLANRTVGESG